MQVCRFKETAIDVYTLWERCIRERTIRDGEREWELVVVVKTTTEEGPKGEREEGLVGDDRAADTEGS